MLKLIKSLLLILFLFSLAGCYSLIPPSDPTSLPNTNRQEAQKALIDFFHLLHEGDYQAGANLYAGSYEWLIDINPDIPTTDFAALLERGCRKNGLMCLESRTVEAVLMTSSTGYIFQVEFNLDDGSLFALEYCCGATETDKPPVSKFQFRVQEGEDGSWRVADLPPYVP